MLNFSAAPTELIHSFWRNRELILSLTRRDVMGRYRGSVMGLLWSFFNPLFMLAVYTFVFSVVFNARWGEGTGSKTEFALVLYAGLIVFNVVSECLNRAPTLILANANYVKKVVFPLEILPWVALGSALFHAAIGLGVWLLAYMALFGLPHATVVLLPLIIVPLLLFVLGITWGLASLGVYLRDVAQVVGIATTVLLFMSPIFYPITALPEAYRSALYLNPLTPAIEQVRAVLYWGRGLDGSVVAVSWVAAIAFAWAGFAWFQKTRKGFADVI